MSDTEIKRIVLACDAASEIGSAVRDAAVLAAKWCVPVHGVFVENENLLRLAELPFGRQHSLSLPGISESLTATDIETLFSSLAAAMRRTLAAAAAEAGLDWSFAIVQDMAEAATAPEEMLVLEAGPRPFYGSWRPRSHWEGRASEFGATVLVRREEAPSRDRVVVVLASNQANHARILAAVRALTTPESRITVIAIAEPDLADAVEQMLAKGLQSAGINQISIEGIASSSDLGRRLSSLNLGLLAIETAALAEKDIKMLVAETCCDVLLVT